MSAGTVSVTRLMLTAFRSYSAVQMEIDPSMNQIVLTGRNGAGKTNILEALSFLAPGRGLRRAALDDVRQHDTDGNAPMPWAISADIMSGHTPCRVGTGEDPSQTARRAVRLDGQSSSQSEALADLWNIVWLTPQMDRLFLEGPSSRRRFLDRMVLGLHPRHAAQVSGYERLMRERNRLLSDGPFDDVWCSALEARMAEHGAAIAEARVDYAAQLVGQMDTNHVARDAGFPRADLALDGDGEAMVIDGAKAVDVEAGLKVLWARDRAGDRARGRTSAGPHRTDMQVTHRETMMDAAQCSTGEQKALLLSLVLSNARLLAAIRGRLPILLMDEVAAHLDAERRSALFRVLEDLGCQTWLTGTDLDLFTDLASAQFFSVANGNITKAKR